MSIITKHSCDTVESREIRRLEAIARDLMPQPMDTAPRGFEPTRVYVPSMFRWVDAGFDSGSWYMWPADVHGRSLIHPTHWRKEPAP